MKKMARMQPRGITKRDIGAKEETPLNRAEKKLPP